jgi:PKD domain
VIAFAAPAVASAEIFCVHSPLDCVGTTSANLQAALNAADANGAGTDTINLGVGLFNDGPAVDVAGNPVDIIGTAANQTAIRSSSNAASLVILDIEEPTSTISHLRVHHTSTSVNATGIVLKGTATDVLVDNDNFTTQFDGVRMVGTQAILRNSVVTLLYPANTQNRAVFVTAGSTAQVRESNLQGTIGVLADGDTTVRRSLIRATIGVLVSSGATAGVSDTLIQVPGPYASNFIHSALSPEGTGTSVVNATRVTAYAGDGQGYGVWVAPNGGAGNNASANLKSTVVHGFGNSIYAQETGGGDSSAVDTSYSAYDLGTASIDAGATYTHANSVDLADLDPGFVNAAHGDFRLRFDSPLIDHGDPGDTQPAPLICLLFGCSDFGGLVRRVDGDGNGSTIVDIAANEYQRRAPLAMAKATPASVTSRELISFDASGSSDPDADALTYAWSFDDGGSTTGSVASHAFATTGDHNGTVTVTDSTGLTATAVATVSVAQPQTGTTGSGGGGSDTPPPANPSVADLTAPVITGARADPARFGVARGPTALVARLARGTRFRFTLSEHAAVTIVIQRARPGRRLGKRCVAPSPRFKRARRCTRFAKTGTLRRRDLGPGSVAVAFTGRLGRRALKPGAYRALISAVDAAGNKSAAQRAKFRIALR